MEYFATTSAPASPRALGRRARGDPVRRRGRGAPASRDVFDICHLAVEFEDIGDSLERLVRRRRSRCSSSRRRRRVKVPGVTEESGRERCSDYADDRVSDADHREAGRQGHALPESARMRSADVERGSGPARMAHPLPRAGVPRWSGERFGRRVTRSSRRSRFTRHSPVWAPARDRDLHLGCAAGGAQVRRHRRLRLAGARVGARPTGVNKFIVMPREGGAPSNPIVMPREGGASSNSRRDLRLLGRPPSRAMAGSTG